MSKVVQRAETVKSSQSDWRQNERQHKDVSKETIAGLVCVIR